MAGGQASSQPASGSPQRWKDADEVLDFQAVAPQLKNSAPKSNPSLLSVVLGKRPLTTSVSRREVHRYGAGCEGGRAKVKKGGF